MVTPVLYSMSRRYPRLSRQASGIGGFYWDVFSRVYRHIQGHASRVWGLGIKNLGLGFRTQDLGLG